MLDIILWVIAAALMVIGFAGTIVPMIPGLPLIFAGAWLAAFIDHYDEISVMTLVILAVLTVIGLIVDWVAQTLGAQKAGAIQTRYFGLLHRHTHRYLYRFVGADFYAAARRRHRRIY